MTRGEYWIECVSEALDAAGVTATQEQIACMADIVAGGHETIGMAFGDDVADRNWHATQRSDAEATKSALRYEQEKRGCQTCNGRGRLNYNSGPWAVDTQCTTCRGDGKVHPSQL